MNWFWDNIHLKKEDRTGMLIFICMLFGFIMLKWYMVVWYTPQDEYYNEDVFANMEYAIIEPVAIDKKTKPKKSYTPWKKKINSKSKGASSTKRKEAVAEIYLFAFDPNTISVDSLQLLGISKYAANNINKYRSNGGRFFRTNDLQKIYGLDSLLYKRIQPYIQIKTQKIAERPKEEKRKIETYAKPKLALNSIEINLADTLEFKKLKGIGSVYANRIVKFRNSLGGYFSVDQIKEVWGVSDSLFLAIKPYLSADSTRIEKRNINLLDKEILVQHPYINWKKAKIILNYKKMHGDYKSMDDFGKMHGISDAFVDTLTQYFIAG